MNRLPIRDIEVIDMDDQIIYYTKDMKDNNILIEESTIMFDKNVETIISVKCLTRNNAEDFTLYWDTLLSPIQVYRIVKDIIDLYNDYHVVDFLKIMRNMSTTYTSSSMQSKPDNRLDVRGRIEEVFRLIK